MRHLLLFASLTLLSCAPKAAGPAISADPAQAEVAPPQAPLPLDPEVRTGTLDNGLTWYIEVNREPEQRAELRLVVDAGSVLEDDDQRGLAHLLEHLAFNGTEHFPGNSLITYLESIGTQFGAHLNAYTSLDETVYMLKVPTDDEAIFDKGLLVLRDWAGGLSFDPEEIDKERGVVLEEWRLSLGPGERIGEQIRPHLFAGTPYPDRMPIGTEESLRTFTHEAVERFYRDWYRPDLMAVVAVGDFDPDRVQREIEERFSDLRGPEAPRERPRHVVPGLDEPVRLVITDPEVPQGNMGVSRVFPEPEGSTHGDYRDSLAEGVFQAALGERLNELSRREDTPLLGVYASRSRLTPASRVDGVGLVPKEGRELEAYELVLTELRRFVELGPTQGEVERARSNSLRFFRSLDLESENTDSGQHAEEIIRVFLTDEPMPGLPYEVAMAERYLPEIGIDDVRKIAEGYLDQPWLAYAVMPEKEGLDLPTVEELHQVEARVATAELAPLQVEGELADPIAPPSEPGTIVTTDTSLQGSLGFTRYELSNGVTVYAKATDFKSDEVVFTGWSPGGMNLLDDADVVPMNTGLSVLRRSGVGALDVQGLQRWSAGKKLQVDVGVSSVAETLSGSASPTDLDDAMQVLHAMVVAPRFEERAFRLERESREESLRNRLVSPSAHFSDAWTAVVRPDDPRAGAWTLTDLERMDLARSEFLYRDRFGDLSDLTLTFVGAIPSDFEQTLERWVATLPAGDRQESEKDRGYRPVEGEHSVVVYKGAEPQASVRIYLHGAFVDPSLQRRMTYRAMLDVLRVQLRERLREDLGGVYGVGVSGSISDRFEPRFDLTVSFSCDPDRVDELAAEVDALFRHAVAAPPEPRLVHQFHETDRRNREQALRTNGYWLGNMNVALDRGEDPEVRFLQAQDRADAVTAVAIQGVAAQVLTTGNVVRGRLLPEAADQEE